MFIFIVYAVLVWWGAFHWRRHLLGFVIVLGGVGLCVLTGVLHTVMGRMTGGDIFMPVFQGLLYPYTALVLAVGLCFVFAPHHTGGRQADGAANCPGCGYNLSGLGSSTQQCPECGLVRTGMRASRHCMHCDHDITARPAGTHVCPCCGRHPRMRAPLDHTSAGSGGAPSIAAPASVAVFRPLSRETPGDVPNAPG